MSYRYLYIPLDERPCNYDFAYEIFNDDFLNIQRVPFEYMGLKKKPGNIEKINDFLIKEAKMQMESFYLLILYYMVESSLLDFTFLIMKPLLNAFPF